MKDLLIFGIPGAGKGTQATRITESLKGVYSHLSTGDIFRALTSKSNAIGNYVTHRMNSGKLIDDQVTIALFNAYFYAVLDDQKYMLLDGYPRTVIQLESFLALAKKHKRQLLGIHYILHADEALERLISRGREGETPEMLKIRLDEYYKKTQPIINLFAKYEMLITIDAHGDIESIHQNTLDAIHAHE